MSINCGNCNGSHESVGQVRDCYEGKSGTLKMKTEPEATLNQKNFAQMLFRERTAEPGTIIAEIEANQGITKAEEAIDSMGKQTISGFIQSMKVQPFRTNVKQRQTLPDADIQDGIYQNNEKQIRKVYKGQSGRLLCKSLEITSEAVWDGDTLMAAAEKEWHYLGQARYYLKGFRLLTADEAKAYGKIYGFCMICGRTLTDEESIKRGIGPICEGNMR